MADFHIIPMEIDEKLYRYSRARWTAAGIDDFVEPPGQNPDNFELLTNVRPPIDGVMRRRFGYASFIPKLDTGMSSSSDTLPNSVLYGAGFDGSTSDVYTDDTVPFDPAATNSVEFCMETYSILGGYFVSLNSTQKAGGTQYFGVYMDTAGYLYAGI